jgi:hypothetical protein
VRMGAVKTSRRICTNSFYYKGAIYILHGRKKRIEKEADRYLQSINFPTEPYREVNNRRKMAGLPLIRRAKS